MLPFHFAIDTFVTQPAQVSHMTQNHSSQSSRRSSLLSSLASSFSKTSSNSSSSKTSTKTSTSVSTSTHSSSGSNYSSSYPYSSGYWAESDGSIYGAFTPGVFGLLPDPSNYLRDPAKYLMNGQHRTAAHPYVAESQRDIRIQLRTTTTTHTVAGFEVTKVVKRYTFPDGSVHETTHTRSEAYGDEANIRELRKYLGQN